MHILDNGEVRMRKAREVHTRMLRMGGESGDKTGGGDAPGRVMLRSSKTMSTCWRPGELEDSRKPAVKRELKKPWGE